MNKTQFDPEANIDTSEIMQAAIFITGVWAIGTMVAFTFLTLVGV